MKAFNVGRSIAIGLLLVLSAVAQAAVSCNVTATDVSVTYNSAANTSTNGDLRISCTRSAGDLSTVFYSIKADFGMNLTGSETRNLKDPVSGSTLSWIFRNIIGAPNCGNATNWGSANPPGLLEGSLSFPGPALTRTVTLNNAYCMRVRGTAGGNPGFPAAGTYSDRITLTSDMSTTSLNGPFNVTAPTTQINFSANVTPICVISKKGANLTFDYTSFRTTPLTNTSQFEATCSNTLRYQVTVSPATGTIAGVNYSVARVGDLNSTGNGNPINAHVKVDIAANQSGTCNTAVCSGSATHTLTITY